MADESAQAKAAFLLDVGHWTRTVAQELIVNVVSSSIYNPFFVKSSFGRRLVGVFTYTPTK